MKAKNQNYPNKVNLESKSKLLEESILPTWLNQRSIGNMSYIWMWVGMAVIIATFQLGADGIASMSLMKVVVTIFFANLALGVVMLLTADIGTEHGISFAVYLRAPFGTIGTHIPSISRGIVAAIWFGIQTYLGAIALNGIINYFTHFDNWFVWYIVFAAIQIFNTAKGIRSVQLLVNIASPCIILISIWMYYTLTDLATKSGKDIWTFTGSAHMSVLALFVANMAFWSALAVDIPNITRFLKTKPSKNFFTRNKNTIIAQFLALPLVQAWIALIGAISFVATGDWNPITVIQGQGTGIVLVVLLIMVIFAQWSTNASANLIPAALSFVNAGAPKLNYAMALIIAGIIGTLAFPWLILNNLFTYLGIYGALLSAIGGIMICDYYLIRKRRLNVPDLYKKNGQFLYNRGFNCAGFIAWIVGGGLAVWFREYSCIIGLPVAFIVYFIVTKSVILKKYPQAEVIDPDDDKYLATSIGKSWVYSNEKGMQGLKTEDIRGNLKRRDL